MSQEFLHVVGVRPAGKKKIYNIALKSEPHNFILESGVVSMNSHAVSYAINMYITAELKARYRNQFLCASLNVNAKKREEDSDDTNDHRANKSRNKDKHRELMQALRIGKTKIYLPDIDMSPWKFTPVEGKNAVKYGMNGLPSINKQAYLAIQNIRPIAGRNGSWNALKIDNLTTAMSTILSLNQEICVNDQCMTFLPAPIAHVALPLMIDAANRRFTIESDIARKPDRKPASNIILPSEKFYHIYNYVNYIRRSLPKSEVNATVIKTLISTGCLDCVYPDRNTMLYWMRLTDELVDANGNIRDVMKAEPINYVRHVHYWNHVRNGSPLDMSLYTEKILPKFEKATINKSDVEYVEFEIETMSIPREIPGINSANYESFLDADASTVVTVGGVIEKMEVGLVSQKGNQFNRLILRTQECDIDVYDHKGHFTTGFVKGDLVEITGLKRKGFKSSNNNMILYNIERIEPTGGIDAN